MIGAPKAFNPIDRLGGGGGSRTVGPISGHTPILGMMHEGGKVPEDGAYDLEKGEKVTPAKEKKDKAAAGRDSDYRRLYLKRKKK
jgi:hypothetical protein